MGSYYIFIWFVCFINLLRLIIQLVVVDIPDLYSPFTDTSWLFIQFCLLFVEISVVIFMCHKHVISGREAFRSTVFISSITALVFTVVMGILIFTVNIPLFDMLPGPSSLFWLIFSIFFLTGYLVLILVPHTRFADLLPERPEFFRYIFLLFCLNFIATLGALLVFLHYGIGYCFWDLQIILYYSLYPPLLYFSFLHSFLRHNLSSSGFKDALLLDQYLEVIDTDM